MTVGSFSDIKLDIHVNESPWLSLIYLLQKINLNLILACFIFFSHELEAIKSFALNCMPLIEE